MSPDFSKNFATQATVNAAGKGKNAGVDTTSPPTNNTSKKGDVRYLLSVCLLALSIVAAGAGFGFNAFLDREIDGIEANITALDDAFKFDDIKGFLLLDKQVQTLKDINFSRGGYPLLLREISDLVVPGAYYTSVSILLVEGDDYSMEVRGFADSLAVYYQQLRSFMSAEGILAGTLESDGYSLQRSEGSDNTAVLFTVSSSIPISKVVQQLDTSL